jgi:serine/threonine-protein kinase
MYELLAGEKPFRGNLEAVTYKICHEAPPPPSTLSKLKLPHAVDALVAKALAKDAADRFPTARAFRDALADVAQMSVEVDNGLGTTVVNIGTLMLNRPAPSWDDETLRTAEMELARALGPMAKLIVRRAATQTTDRSELCSILSESISDPDSRREFVTAFTRSGGTHSTGGLSAHRSGTSSASQNRGGTRGSGAASLTAFDQDYLDAIAAKLAVFAGPIARLLVRNAATSAGSREDLLRRCAETLSEDDRAAFIKQAGRDALRRN